MPTVYCTIGLPASGKSTTARRMAAESGGLVVEVTKDELRLHPDAPPSRGKQERWVIAERDRRVVDALSNGRSIVVHDTNLNPIHPRRLRELATTHGATFEILDFRDVGPVECARRDALRERPVGAHVIWEMWQRWMYQPPTSTPETGKPDAVLVDIDGTLARMQGRSPYDWARVGEDEPVTHIIELVRDLAARGTTIIYLSGRDGAARDATRDWIDTHVGVPGALHMRSAGDTRPDEIVKAELYRAEVEGRFRVRFVLDDRNSVVHMWRTVARIPVLQVEYGHF
jgi:predicted kinase